VLAAHWFRLTRQCIPKPLIPALGSILFSNLQAPLECLAPGIVLAPRGVHLGARVEQLGEEAASPGFGDNALSFIENFEGAVEFGSSGCGREGERSAAPGQFGIGSRARRSS
jgi:hypothetical protein